MDNDPNSQPVDYNKPVAYDANGQPLYSHPAVPIQSTQQSTSEPAPTIVHMTRSLEPIAQEISPELQAKHNRSVKLFPRLDLSEHEYVILSVRRHLIGLVTPAFVTAIFVAIVFSITIFFPEIERTLDWTVPYGGVLVGGLLMVAALLAGMYILYWVYVNNTFFLTNESIIENTQLSLFSSNVKSVGLGDVVNVSYRQSDAVEKIFNYGTVEIGTKDDDISYIFSYVRQPKTQASALKDAVEAFKNGRPLGDDLMT